MADPCFVYSGHSIVLVLGVGWLFCSLQLLSSQASVC